MPALEAIEPGKATHGQLVSIRYLAGDTFVGRQLEIGGLASSLSTLAAGVRAVSRLGLLEPVKLGERIVGRRVIAGV